MSGAVPRGLVVYRALPCLLPRVAHVVDRYCTLGTVVYRVVSPCLLPRVARFSNFFLHPPVHVLVVAWCPLFSVTSGASTSRALWVLAGLGRRFGYMSSVESGARATPPTPNEWRGSTSKLDQDKVQFEVFDTGRSLTGLKQKI